MVSNPERMMSVRRLHLVASLGVTSKGTPIHIVGFAGRAIGLTLVVIHIVGINVTGVSVNPARSLGPALFVGGQALAQLWLFIVAPLVGAGVAGLLYRSGISICLDDDRWEYCQRGRYPNTPDLFRRHL